MLFLLGFAASSLRSFSFSFSLPLLDMFFFRFHPSSPGRQNATSFLCHQKRKRQHASPWRSSKATKCFNFISCFLVCLNYIGQVESVLWRLSLIFLSLPRFGHFSCNFFLCVSFLSSLLVFFCFLFLMCIFS